MPSGCAATVGADLPADLRCTGLYADYAERTLACDVHAYTPAYELWSDGAQKRRFVQLPAGAQIDAADPDAFVFPVGTQLWKEFSLQTEHGWVPGETRLLRKTSEGWAYTTYVWSEDGREAKRKDDGASDLFGTGHSVPTHEQCQECHRGREDFALGWDWLMLGAGARGLTRDELLARGLVKNAGDAASATIPGDDVERAALGYLHANCGVSCHNDSVNAEAHDIELRLRLDHDGLARVQDTAAFHTGVNRGPAPVDGPFGVPLPSFPGGYYVFRPLDPTRSFALLRMEVRNDPRQMPRIGSNRVDEAGVQTVRAWIEHMTVARGYPAPP